MQLRSFTVRMTRRAATLSLLGMCVAAFSAHAALIAIGVAGAGKTSTTVAERGYEAQDHFPGAALFYPTDEQPAPAVGATGTTTLPDMPIPADADLSALDGSIRPAQPFSMANASSQSRARAQQCLTAAIYYEAASESDDGERAVAQVVLNRVRHPAFPSSVCGVVYQGSERTTGCQFSFACDGSMARAPSRSGWARAGGFAAEALAGQVFAPVGLATHYHTYAVTPSWNRSLVMTAAIGAHFFHRWQGWWGTAAAFRQGYSGAEPFPGPHARPAVAPLPRIQMASAPAGTPAAFINAAYADKSVAKPVAAQASTLPESTILDKWKDSGQPLR